MSTGLIALIARTDFYYEGQFFARGTVFRGSVVDAVKLCQAKQVRYATPREIAAAERPAPPPPVDEAPKPKRKYTRRDKTPADDGSPPSTRHYSRRDLEPEP